MSKILFDIQYNVNGTDKFKGIFKESIRDVDQLLKMLDKMATTRVGRKTYGGFKVTPDMKRAASSTANQIRDYKKGAKDPKNMVGYAEKINIQLQKVGEVIETVVANVQRRFASSTGKGITQDTFFAQIRDSMKEMQTKAVNSVRKVMADMNVSDTKGMQEGVKKKIQEVYDKLGRDLQALSTTGKFTRPNVNALLDTARTDANIGAKGFIKSEATRGKVPSLKSALDEGAQKMLTQFNQIFQAFAGNNELVGKAKEIRDTMVSKFAKIRADLQKLHDSGTINPKDFDKLKERLAIVQKQANEEVKNLNKSGNAVLKEKKRAERESARAKEKAAREVARLDKMNARKEEQMASKKAQALDSVKNMVHNNIQKLRAEARTAGRLKSMSIKPLAQDLRNVLNGAKAKIKSTTATDIDALVESLAEITRGARREVAGKVNQRKKGKMYALGEAMNVHTMRGGAGVAGIGLQQMGAQIEKVVSASHTKGRVASGMKDLMTSAMYSSGRMMMIEFSNILGQMADMLVELVTEIPRLIGSALAGILKGIGAMAMKGLATALITSSKILMTAFGGIMTGIMGLITTMGVGIFFALSSIIKDITQMIQNLLSSIMSLIMSVMKLGIQIVTMAIKSTFKIISGLFKGLIGGLKAMFTSFVETVKKGVAILKKLIEASLSEYIKMTEYATRAFKETVGVAGQSVQKFQTLIGGLRGTFGFDTDDVGEAVFDVVSSGYRDVAKAKEISANASMLAVAAESDLKTSTNAMITALQNFNMQGETTETIMRTLASATTLGRMTMGELGNSMKSVMGLASRAGLTFKETMLSLSMMTRVFGRGSIEEGTRFFNRFIESIAMPSSKARKQLEALGISMEGIGKSGRAVEDIFSLVDKMKNLELKDVRKVFTTIQSRRAWLALTKDVDQFKSMLGDFGTVSRNVEFQFKQMFNTPGRLIKRLQQSFRVLLSNVGMSVWESLKDVIMRVAKAIQQMMKWLSSAQGIKFFSEMVKWASPIMNTLFRPLVGGLDKVMEFLIRGRGLGNSFFKIFKSDFAKGIQQGLINAINNIYRLIGYIGIIIDKTRIVQAVFTKVKSILATIFKMFSGADSNKFVADIINGLKKTMVIINDMFQGSKFAREIQNIIFYIQEALTATLRYIGNLIMIIFKPIINSLMTLLGTRLKEVLVGAMSFFMGKIASMLRTVKLHPMFQGMVEGMASGFSKLSKNASSVRGEDTKYKKIENQDTLKDLRDIFNERGQDIMGIIANASPTGLGVNLASAGKSFEEWLEVMENLSKQSTVALGNTGYEDERIRALVGRRNTSMSESGGFAGDRKTQEDVLREFAPRLLDAMKNIPRDLKVAKGTENETGFGWMLPKLTKSIRDILKGEGQSDDYQALDAMVTQLTALNNESMARQFGVSSKGLSDQGVDPRQWNELTSAMASMQREFSIRKQSLKRAKEGEGQFTNAMIEAKKATGTWTKAMAKSYEKIKQETKALYGNTNLGINRTTTGDVQSALGRKIDPNKSDAIQREKKVNKLKKIQEERQAKYKRAVSARDNDMGSKSYENLVRDAFDAVAMEGKVAFDKIDKYAEEAMMVLTQGETTSDPIVQEIVAKVKQNYGKDLHQTEVDRRKTDLDEVNRVIGTARGANTDEEIKKQANDQKRKNYTNNIQRMTDEELRGEYKKQKGIKKGAGAPERMKNEFEDDGSYKQVVGTGWLSEMMRAEKDQLVRDYEADGTMIEGESGMERENMEDFAERTGRTNISERDIKTQERIDSRKKLKGKTAQEKIKILEKEEEYRKGEKTKQRNRQKELNATPEEEKKNVQRKFNIADTEESIGKDKERMAELQKRLTAIQGDFVYKQSDKGKKEQDAIRKEFGDVKAGKASKEKSLEAMKAEQKAVEDKKETAKNSAEADKAVVDTKKVLDKTLTVQQVQVKLLANIGGYLKAGSSGASAPKMKEMTKSFVTESVTTVV